MSIQTYCKELYYAYQTGNLFNFLGIKPPQFIIRFLDFFLRFRAKSKENQIRKVVFSNWSECLCFRIDARYESWIQDFLSFLQESKHFKETTDEKVASLTLLVGDHKTKKIEEKPDIFIDLADGQEINESFYQLVKTYIKRETNPKYHTREKLVAMPYLFSTNAKKTKEAQAKLLEEGTWEQASYYLSFWGRSLDSNRKERLANLEQLLWDKLYQYGASFQKHIAILNQSKYGLNLFGGGEYCHRFTEIANTDTLMISQRYSILVPENFTDMENIVFFSSPAELVSKLELLDSNPELYTKIKSNFKQHYEKHHSHQAYCEKLRREISLLIS